MLHNVIQVCVCVCERDGGSRSSRCVCVCGTPCVLDVQCTNICLPPPFIVQELKGNIRVFCRARPVSAAEQANTEHDSALSVEFPVSNDVLGASIVLQVCTCVSVCVRARVHACWF